MLTKKQIKLLAQFRSRHGRRKSNAMLAEGIRCCEEALTRQPGWLEFAAISASFAESADGVRLQALLDATGSRPEVMPDRDFAGLAVTENPQGILCVLRRPELGCPPTTITDPFVLVLDRIREPGNMGTILRTAWAVGLKAVWLTLDSADPYAPKVLRSGMGAQFALRIHQVADLAESRDRLEAAAGGPLWLAVPHGGVSCFETGFDLRGAGLVIGNEAGGIEDLGVGLPVSIPMPGNAESLNAAQAATVLLFEGVRRGLMQAPARENGPSPGA